MLKMKKKKKKKRQQIPNSFFMLSLIFCCKFDKDFVFVSSNLISSVYLFITPAKLSSCCFLIFSSNFFRKTNLFLVDIFHFLRYWRLSCFTIEYYLIYVFNSLS